ncbi:hypothetical protein HII13_003234 [Brettanomyces bruxellensis]|uniref:DEBR0S3_01134g1_1 n=1 Tax=Dekkera bruxellensis TaxID=5007 RepID=A0A7D9CY52_DEKBR|nr:hypothetical protein HII13_003234 [Brettanomyces bruxellensis]VUG18053.1 DEBR0S3_01134g1_1 [Brettanomyces bruxellensis]
MVTGGERKGKANKRVAFLFTPEVDESTPKQMDAYMHELRIRGYFIRILTWLTFVIGMGSIFGLWEWCFSLYSATLFNTQVPIIGPVISYLKLAVSDKMVVDHYYTYAFLLNFVIIWLWCVASWLGMKLFRHSKGGGS